MSAKRPPPPVRRRISHAERAKGSDSGPSPSHVQTGRARRAKRTHHPRRGRPQVRSMARPSNTARGATRAESWALLIRDEETGQTLRGSKRQNNKQVKHETGQARRRNRSNAPGRAGKTPVHHGPGSVSPPGPQRPSARRGRDSERATALGRPAGQPVDEGEAPIGLAGADRPERTGAR